MKDGLTVYAPETAGGTNGLGINIKEGCQAYESVIDLWPTPLNADFVRS